MVFFVVLSESSFGYVSQPSKCFVVMSASQLDKARHVSGGLGLQVVTGHRYLSGFIGDCGLGQEFVLYRLCGSMV